LVSVDITDGGRWDKWEMGTPEYSFLVFNYSVSSDGICTITYSGRANERWLCQAVIKQVIAKSSDNYKVS